MSPLQLKNAIPDLFEDILVAIPGPILIKEIFVPLVEKGGEGVGVPDAKRAVRLFLVYLIVMADDRFSERRLIGMKGGK